VTKSVRKPVSLELAGKYCRGMTVVSWDAEPGVIATEIVQSLDLPLLKHLIITSIK
jgi:inosine-uridine nucleoside N-ribohydrolase